MYRILLLSSAAIAFSGCSLIKGNSNNIGQSQSSYSQPHSQLSASGYNNCGVSQCAPTHSYSGPDNYPSDSYTHAHDVSQNSQYSYGAPQQPSAQSYGSQVRGLGQGQPVYAGQGRIDQNSGQFPKLRGAFGSQGFNGYSYGTLGVINYDKNSEVYGIQGRLGYQATQYFGAEAEGSFGVFSDSQTIGATEVNSGVDYSVAAFGRGVVPLGQRFNIFGRAGYHITEINGSVTDATGTIDNGDTTDGFAYGGGAEFAITPRDAIRLDYTRYDLGPNDTDSLAVSYARKF